ncbi:uncharacterized protein LOC128468357 [Spea bombifrons]|uniref:uncharacterized protein LOC128468357 n=1 Tax=Spea bombifrons TaxID=233779 RepID=UPI00234A1228|nr:uncharacterized protein LOC128468357 [Spea bombifrons]
MDTDRGICPNCGQGETGKMIFHDIYCYDVYILSPQCPHTPNQCKIDFYMAENIVKPLEEEGYNCYYASRNIPGGKMLIQAMSYPISIIPVTVVPVFRDSAFIGLQNFILRPKYLDRVVFILFDSTQIFPLVSQNTYSIHVDDKFLLPKLIETIRSKTQQLPLEERKMKYERMKENDQESTVSSTTSDFHRQISFRRSNRSAKSDFTISSTISEVHSQIQFRRTSIAFPEIHLGEAVSIEDVKRLASTAEILYYCSHEEERIRYVAAITLTKAIQKNITTFSMNAHLQEFENALNHTMNQECTKKWNKSLEFTKLCFWISALAYIKVGKYHITLKAHMKCVTLKKRKATKNQFDLCQTYQKLIVCILKKVKTPSNRLDGSNLLIKNLQSYISILDGKTSFSSGKARNENNILANLPWDAKHIYVSIITEKIIAKKFSFSIEDFFKHICSLVGKKHWDIFLPVVEKVTEYILENGTGACYEPLKLLEMIWNLQKTTGKKHRLTMILKHFSQKLLYHPVHDVRKFITPFLFECLCGKGVELLGSACIQVDQDIVDRCMHEKLSSSNLDLTIKEQVKAGPFFFKFEIKTPNCDNALLYMLKQNTLNDILQTNSTDCAFEQFQEMSRAVEICQGNDNIIELLSTTETDILPFYMVEHGKPLLQYLHEKENQLTWTQMIDILIDVTKAIDHCHGKRVILRDITAASFVVIPKVNETYQTKLASFQYAKHIQTEENNISASYYEEDTDKFFFRGDGNEPVAVYFTAPETLEKKIFTNYTETWMLTASIYSILLYGRQPFQELAHLTLFQYVKEITSDHKVQIPNSFAPDLWAIISRNLDYKPDNRTDVTNLLQDLVTYKNNLGPKGNTIYRVKSVCCLITPDDIQRGHIDNKGYFIQEINQENSQKVYKDHFNRTNYLHEVVSVRMCLETRKKIKELNHLNLLGMRDIKSHPYTTELVSYPFTEYTCTLETLSADTGMNDLLTYFGQLTSALQYLHSNDIVHCNLQCSHIYVNPKQRTLILGHFGRAVYIRKPVYPYVFKMMPPEAEKWSAPEVIKHGMYSRESDIFNLAIVFWEAISNQKMTSNNYQLKPFKQCTSYMEIFSTFPDSSDTQGDCLYELCKCMQNCWNPNQTKRPSIDQIVNTIMLIERDCTLR